MLFRAISKESCLGVEQFYQPQIATMTEKIKYADCVHEIYGMPWLELNSYWSNVLIIILTMILILQLIFLSIDKTKIYSLDAILVGLAIYLSDGNYKKLEFRELIDDLNTSSNNQLPSEKLTHFFVRVIIFIIMIFFLIILNLFMMAIAVLTLDYFKPRVYPEHKFEISQYPYGDELKACHAFVENYHKDNIGVGDKIYYGECINMLYPKFSWFPFNGDMWVYIAISVMICFLFALYRSQLNIKQAMKFGLIVGIIGIFMSYCNYYMTL